MSGMRARRRSAMRGGSFAQASANRGAAPELGAVAQHASRSTRVGTWKSVEIICDLNAAISVTYTGLTFKCGGLTDTTYGLY
jgi:hypothetical protein